MHDHSCKKNCFSTISPEIIQLICRQYVPKDALKKNEWIRNYLQFNQVVIGNDTNIRWNLDRHDVYKQCWMVATIVSKFKMKNCWRTENNNIGARKISAKLTSIVAWLGSYFDDVCDRMPTKNEYYLPCFIFWSDILAEMNSYLFTNDHLTPITPSYFSIISIC
jgi:hypothetical protein